MASLNLKHGVGDKGDPRRDEPSPESARDQLARLDRYERTHGRSGAMPRALKGMIIDEAHARAEAVAGSDRHVRGINASVPEKLMNASIQGYEVVLDKEGQPIKAGPSLIMMSCPREMFEERQQERDDLTSSQLGYDADGRRRDSPEFYNKAEEIASLAAGRGHASGRSVDRIVRHDPPSSIGD